MTPALAALSRLIAWREAIDADDPRHPRPDPGCVMCTRGTTPDRFNTGLCPWHEAYLVLHDAMARGKA